MGRIPNYKARLTADGTEKFIIDVNNDSHSMSAKVLEQYLEHTAVANPSNDIFVYEIASSVTSGKLSLTGNGKLGGVTAVSFSFQDKNEIEVEDFIDLMGVGDIFMLSETGASSRDYVLFEIETITKDEANSKYTFTVSVEGSSNDDKTYTEDDYYSIRVVSSSMNNPDFDLTWEEDGTAIESQTNVRNINFKGDAISVSVDDNDDTTLDIEVNQYNPYSWGTGLSEASNVISVNKYNLGIPQTRAIGDGTNQKLVLQVSGTNGSETYSWVDETASQELTFGGGLTKSGLNVTVDRNNLGLPNTKATGDGTTQKKILQVTGQQGSESFSWIDLGNSLYTLPTASTTEKGGVTIPDTSQIDIDGTAIDLKDTLSSKVISDASKPLIDWDNTHSGNPTNLLEMRGSLRGTTKSSIIVTYGSGEDTNFDFYGTDGGTYDAVTPIATITHDSKLKLGGSNELTDTLIGKLDDVPSLPTGNGNTQKKVLQTTGAAGSESYSWVDEPSFTNSFRPIEIEGVAAPATQTLNFKGGNGITVSRSAGVITWDSDLPTLPSGIDNDTEKIYELKLTDVEGTETLSWVEAAEAISTTTSTADVFNLNESGEFSAVDAGSDKVVAWDDSAGKLTYLSAADLISATGILSTANTWTADQDFQEDVTIGSDSRTTINSASTYDKLTMKSVIHGDMWYYSTSYTNEEFISNRTTQASGDSVYQAAFHNNYLDDADTPATQSETSTTEIIIDYEDDGDTKTSHWTKWYLRQRLGSRDTDGTDGSWVETLAVTPNSAKYNVPIIFENLTANPTSDVEDGMVYYNSTDDVLKVRANGSWVDVGSGDTVTVNTVAADVLSVSSGDISAVDNGSDALVGWDDSAGKLTYLSSSDVISAISLLSTAHTWSANQTFQEDVELGSDSRTTINSASTYDKTTLKSVFHGDPWYYSTSYINEEFISNRTTQADGDSVYQVAFHNNYLDDADTPATQSGTSTTELFVDYQDDGDTKTNHWTRWYLRQREGARDADGTDGSWVETLSIDPYKAKFNVPIVLENLTANPTADVEDGMIYYNSTDDVIRIRANSAWVDLGEEEVGYDEIEVGTSKFAKEAVLQFNSDQFYGNAGTDQTEISLNHQVNLKQTGTSTQTTVIRLIDTTTIAATEKTQIDFQDYVNGVSSGNGARMVSFSQVPNDITSTNFGGTLKIWVATGGTQAKGTGTLYMQMLDDRVEAQKPFRPGSYTTLPSLAAAERGYILWDDTSTERKHKYWDGDSWEELGGSGGDTVTINTDTADILAVSSGDISAVDAGDADAIPFWDNSASKLTYASIGNGLEMSTTTLQADIDGASLSLGASGLSINLANANTWTANQTFNANVDFGDSSKTNHWSADTYDRVDIQGSVFRGGNPWWYASGLNDAVVEEVFISDISSQAIGKEVYSGKFVSKHRNDDLDGTSDGVDTTEILVDYQDDGATQEEYWTRYRIRQRYGNRDVSGTDGDYKTSLSIEPQKMEVDVDEVEFTAEKVEVTIDGHTREVLDEGRFTNVVVGGSYKGSDKTISDGTNTYSVFQYDVHGTYYYRVRNFNDNSETIMVYDGSMSVSDGTLPSDLLNSADNYTITDTK